MLSFQPTFGGSLTNALNCSNAIRGTARSILRRPAGFGLRESASTIGWLQSRKAMISSGSGSAGTINTI
jgi:hypothetical protein